MARASRSRRRIRPTPATRIALGLGAMLFSILGVSVHASRPSGAPPTAEAPASQPGSFQGPEDFEAGKRILYRVHAGHPVELYCGCRYAAGRVDPGCPADAPKFRDRLSRIEAEHMVPAADFGRQRACWREAGKGKGREHCRAVDETFRRMEGDPHNLWPAIGALNAIRSDYRYGEVPGEARVFGACDFEVSPAGAGRFVEPPEDAKGIVARAYFYMEAVYGNRIGGSQRRVLEAWDRAHPPSEFEVERARQIEQLTGLHNPVVERGPRN